MPVLELLFTNTEFARAIQEGLAFSDKILIVASTYVNYFVQRSLELFQNPTPVSYTHLDVYKRQV